VEFRAPRRSLDQNALMWSLLGQISKQVEWYGQKLTSEDWKDVLTASLRRTRVVPGIDAGTFVPLGMRTSQMTKEEWAASCRTTLEYFPGDGLSSHYRTPGGIPMTSYRYNAVGETLTCSVVEGETVDLPENVADHISRVTDKTWPESYWAPRGMTSFEYMSRIGPNHDANSFGLIAADMITLNAMLRIPVDMHNVPAEDVFCPTMWDRFGGDDFRACAYLGPLYA